MSGENMTPEAQIAELQEQLAAANKTIEALKASNTELQEQLAAANKTIEALKASNAELQEQVESLSDEVEAEKPVSFTVKKKEYRFVAPGLIHRGIKLTAAEAARDKALCEHLVKVNSGLIEPVK